MRGFVDKCHHTKEEHREFLTMVEPSRAYIQLLTLHIDKEKNKLFPMANARLSQEAQERLLESFEV